MMKGVLVVTGGSRGIGKGICLAAGASGWKVAVNYANAEDDAQAVVDKIKTSGGSAVAIKADISIESEIESMLDQAEATLGSLTGLVNNAGIMGSIGTVDEIDAESTRRMFEVNLMGPFLCCKHAIKRMAKKNGGNGGAIVNISGQAALHGGVGSYVDLAVSKSAIDRLTRSLGKEQGQEGIRVNAVRPGVVMTEGNVAWDNLNPGWSSSIISETPLGRAGEVSDIASAVLWLLSDQANFVTGAILDVNGGFTTEQA
jgi:NAD(P)-dependent dehydrogenase (short-subunit alcohol dehydrogenase family)